MGMVNPTIPSIPGKMKKTKRIGTLLYKGKSPSNHHLGEYVDFIQASNKQI